MSSRILALPEFFIFLCYDPLEHGIEVVQDFLLLVLKWYTGLL